MRFRPHAHFLPAAALTLVAAMACKAPAGETPPSPAVTLVDRLCAAYRGLDTIYCDIRKTTEGRGRRVEMLSRVFYQRPGRIHVENVSPAQRRILVDGKQLYYHQADAPRGYSRPIGELNDMWLTAAHNIPATAMEHLLRLEGLPETALPATEDFPVRAAYDATNTTAVLSCDTRGRLVRVEFFASPQREDKRGQYDYGDFYEVTDACWIPRLHKAVLYLPDGKSMQETRRIDNLIVNEPVPESMFNPTVFFKDVVFTNDFKMTYSD